MCVHFEAHVKRKFGWCDICHIPLDIWGDLRIIRTHQQLRSGGHSLCRLHVRPPGLLKNSLDTIADYD